MQSSSQFLEELIITTGMLNEVNNDSDIVFAKLDHARTGHVFFIHQFNSRTGKALLSPYDYTNMSLLGNKIHVLDNNMVEVNLTLLPEAEFDIECFDKPISLLMARENEAFMLNAIKSA